MQPVSVRDANVALDSVLQVKTMMLMIVTMILRIMMTMTRTKIMAMTMMITMRKKCKELKEMIGEMDEDDSGTVDFEEYVIVIITLFIIIIMVIILTIIVILANGHSDHININLYLPYLTIDH